MDVLAACRRGLSAWVCLARFLRIRLPRLLGVCEHPAWQGSESRRESVRGGLSETSLFQTLSPPRQAVRLTGKGVRLDLLSKVKSRTGALDATPVIPAKAGIHFDLLPASRNRQGLTDASRPQTRLSPTFSNFIELVPPREL